MNIDGLNKLMKRAGFSVVVEYNLNMQGNYSKLLAPNIKELFIQYKGLSDADKFHVGLYKNIIYARD